MHAMHLKLSAAAPLVLAAAAFAQPIPVNDLGPLPEGFVTQIVVGVSPNTVPFVKFSIPEVSRCQRRYLDIETRGFNAFDTEIALYTSTGERITNDDDDGIDTSSSLTFGANLPLRPSSGNGQTANGRDGPLPAGTYYLAVAAFNATFEDTEWTVFPDGESAGGGTGVMFTLGATPPLPAEPATLRESPCAADAGDLPATAVAGPGTGPLTTIRGNGNRRNDIDMYRICVTDAANFSADTFQSIQMDTQLYLFDSTGRGVSLNDDIDEGVQSRISSQVVAQRGNGTYYLAITPSSSIPQDAQGRDLWSSENFGERPADGPGAANPVARWSQFVFNDNTWYIITLNGASFCPAGPICGTADFNGDGDVGTDQDIEAFFRCLAGTCCATCFPGGADFNGDGDVGTDQDIEAFFRVLAGNPC